MFSLQAIEDRDKEKRRAERLQQRLTIVDKSVVFFSPEGQQGCKLYKLSFVQVS